MALTAPTATENSTNMMRNMNPMWAKSSFSDINEDCEKACAWLCDKDKWSEYKTSDAEFALGACSLEMFTRAYNIWKNGTISGSLTPVLGTRCGYKTINNGSSITDDFENGPNNIFAIETTDAGARYWMCSPNDTAPREFVLLVHQDGNFISSYTLSTKFYLCPIASIGTAIN